MPFFRGKKASSFLFFFFFFPNSSTAEPYLEMLDRKVFGFGRDDALAAGPGKKEAGSKDSFHKLLCKAVYNYRGWQWKTEQPPRIPLSHSATYRDSLHSSCVMSWVRSSVSSGWNSLHHLSPTSAKLLKGGRSKLLFSFFFLTDLWLRMSQKEETNKKLFLH